MQRRLPLSLLKWLTALLLAGSLLAAAYVVNGLAQTERAAESQADKVDAPKRVENHVVKLGTELAQSRGVKDEPAQAVSWSERLPIYGRVVPNPQATVEVRSPFPGTLRADPNTPWPAPGRWLQAGRTLGHVDIRIGPQERLDFQAKLSEARLKQKGAEEVLKIQQDRVDRFRKAGMSESVSRQELDSALVALAEARTQMETAKAAVDLWQKALSVIERRNEHSTSTWSDPLIAPADGEVTELTGRPGMAVEAGGVIARVVDFRRPWVRLDIPPEALGEGPPQQVDLFAVTAAAPTPGEMGSAIPATLVGAAPQVDLASQFAGYWYEAKPVPARQPGRVSNERNTSGTAWRPGLFVTANIKMSAARSQAAVAVPRTALLYHQGRPIVYVRRAPGEFERREVSVLGREGERWVLASGVAAGEPVVYCQTQVLLSEELRGEGDND